MWYYRTVKAREEGIGITFGRITGDGQTDKIADAKIQQTATNLPDNLCLGLILHGPFKDKEIAETSV